MHLHFRTPLKVAACSTLSLLSACTQFSAVTDEGHRREINEQFSRVDQHSSFAAMNRSRFEQVNLLELIDPKRESLQAKYKDEWTRDSPSSLAGLSSAEKDDLKIGRQYDLVLSWFTDQPERGDWKRMRRNSVQDKILAVSSSRCNVFKTYLRRQQVDVNFSLGSLTTAAGVLGAVLPGATASRNLAGSAGLFSGLRSEYNQSYYSNLAAHVIVQGIELRQNRLKKELIEGRQNRSVAEYTMEAAINDAIVIDGNCSAIAGLMEAQESIREMENPGLKMATRVIASSQAMRELAQKPTSQIIEEGNLQKLLALAGADVPSILVTSTKRDAVAALSSQITDASNAHIRLASYIDLRASTVADSFEALQGKAKADQKGSLDSNAIRASVSASLTESVFKPLTKDSPDGVLGGCMKALQTTTLSLGSANANLLLAQSDGDKKISAQLALEKARADASAAVARVERAVQAAMSEIDAKGQSMLSSLSKAADKTGGLKALKTEDLTRDASTSLDVTKLSCP